MNVGYDPRVFELTTTHRGAVALLVALTCVAFASGGCEERVVRSGWEDFGTGAGPGPEAQREQQQEQSRKSSEQAASRASDVTWAISVGIITGPGHREIAEQRRQQLAAATGLKDLWVSSGAARSEVLHGHYQGENDKAAAGDLRRWRDLLRQGVVDIPGVMLVPTHLAGSMPQYDLFQADPRAAYTLEIASFDPGYGPTFRKAAEQAAATLRQQGVEAYYYHALDRSSVTIGAFPEQAVKQVFQRGGQTPQTVIDPRVLALQKQYPHYLVNNRKQMVNTSQPGSDESPQPQPTYLAEIPR